MSAAAPSIFCYGAENYGHNHAGAVASTVPSGDISSSWRAAPNGKAAVLKTAAVKAAYRFESCALRSAAALALRV